MTFGIGICGAGAGLAALRALQAVEAVSRGMINGFVSMAVAGDNGKVLRAATQRGGSAALLEHGSAGEKLPREFAAAPIAVLMSSGPDRAEPLSQFTPALANVGFVSGHRLANMPGRDGTPLNAAVLDRMAAGQTAAEAVAQILDENPEADAGVIAVACDGSIALGNSALVARRSDAGLLRLREAGLNIAILHNAIFPLRGLAEIAAGAAVDAVAPADRHDFVLMLRSGLRLELAAEASLEIDRDFQVTAISVTHPGWLSDHWQGAAALRGTPVLRDGIRIGSLVAEAYCVARGGFLVSLDGAELASLSAVAVP